MAARLVWQGDIQEPPHAFVQLLVTPPAVETKTYRVVITDYDVIVQVHSTDILGAPVWSNLNRDKDSGLVRLSYPRNTYHSVLAHALNALVPPPP